MTAKPRRRSPATKALEDIKQIAKVTIAADDSFSASATPHAFRVGFLRGQVKQVIEMIEAAQRGEK